MTDERREGERVAVSIPVQFTLDDGVVKSGSVENISKTGILLVSPEIIRTQAKIRLMFSDPTSERTIELVGQIVRTAAVGTFGVSFIQASGEALAFIDRITSAVA